MNELESWLADAYFGQSPAESADGGTTSQGALWHAISPRWGHSMHTLCSYHGMFPARLVHYFLNLYTDKGDRVLDPFSGRGTTVLQSRVEDRVALGGDLNPLAFVLTRAKASPPSWVRFSSYLTVLEERYNPEKVSIDDVSPDIQMLFSSQTLRQLLYLRSRLVSRSWAKWSDNDFMLAGCVAGVLHGGHRADGTSAYLSISMPNTFSMSPEYVRRFISANKLSPPDHNVFDVLKDKAARIYRDAIHGPRGRAYFKDAVALLGLGREIPGGTVDLVMTSPPYLRVVNYATSNWIRLWWLGVEDAGRERGAGRLELDARLDHRHTFDTYKEFMLRVFKSTRRVLRPDGIAVFVIGDVAGSHHDPLELATSLWEEVGHNSGLRLLDTIEDRLQANNKVSRIWGETKGQATEFDRILVLGRSDGNPRSPRDAAVDWAEPYKDAGPDAAHQRSNHTRAVARS